jgi:sarcosine oxidase
VSAVGAVGAQVDGPRDRRVIVVGGGAMGSATAWALARRGLVEALLVCGVPFEYLTGPEAQGRWPGMRFDDRVVVQKVAGRAHADRTVAALQAQAARHGAEVRQHVRVTGIEVAADGGAVVHVVDQASHSDGAVTSLRASAVVVTAGAWTSGLLAGVPGFDELPPLVVTQVQSAHFPVRDQALVADDAWPSFIHHVDPAAHAEARLPEAPDGGYPPTGAYGHHTPGEGVRVGHHGTGPVVDPDTRDLTAEPGRLAELRAYVREWLPGVDADAPAPISGTSTTTPDERFLLDRVGPVVIGAGFSGHGFTFTPGIGQVLADLATDVRPEVPGVDLDAFALARFTAGAAAAAAPEVVEVVEV